MSAIRFSASLLAAAVLSCAAGAPANAGARAACDLLSLTEVHALTASSVTIFEAGSNKPSVRGDTTYSNCAYVLQGNGRIQPGRFAKINLMWAPGAKLSQARDIYTNVRHVLAAVKGGVLVTAEVGNTHLGDGRPTTDAAASQKLLDAVLRKV